MWQALHRSTHRVCLNVLDRCATLYYTFWRFTSPFAVCERRRGDCRGDCRGDWRGGACVAITAAVSASTTLVSAVAVIMWEHCRCRSAVRQRRLLSFYSISMHAVFVDRHRLSGPTSGLLSLSRAGGYPRTPYNPAVMRRI